MKQWPFSQDLGFDSTNWLDALLSILSSKKNNKLFPIPHSQTPNAHPLEYFTSPSPGNIIPLPLKFNQHAALTEHLEKER